MIQLAKTPIVSLTISRTAMNLISRHHNALPGPLLLAMVDKSMFKNAVSLRRGLDLATPLMISRLYRKAHFESSSTCPNWARAKGLKLPGVFWFMAKLPPMSFHHESRLGMAFVSTL